METRRQNERLLFGYVEDLKSEIHQLKRTVGVLSHWAKEWSERERERKGRRGHPYAGARKGKAVATMVAHGRSRVEEGESGTEWDTSGWWPPRME